MAERNVYINITLKGAAAAGSGLKSLAGGFLNVGRSAMSGLKGAFDSLFNLKNLILGGLVYGAYRQLKAAVLDVVSAYQEQEDATQKLNVNLQSMGNYSAMVTSRLHAQATALQKITVYGDETIVQGQAMLASYGATGAEIERITPIVLNFAAATGTDLGSAFDLAGKASVGYTATLSRYGIIIDDEIPKAEKFEAALVAMAQRGGRAAEQMAKTSGGALKQLGNAWGELKESAGKFLMESPAVQGFFADLKQGLEDAMTWIDKNKDAIQAYVTKGLNLLREKAVAVWETFQEWAKDGTLLRWLDTLVLGFREGLYQIRHGLLAVKELTSGGMFDVIDLPKQQTRLKQLKEEIAQLQEFIKTGKGGTPGDAWEVRWAWDKGEGTSKEEAKKKLNDRLHLASIVQARIDEMSSPDRGGGREWDKLKAERKAIDDLEKTRESRIAGFAAGWAAEGDRLAIEKETSTILADILGYQEKILGAKSMAMTADKESLRLTKEQKSALEDFAAMGKLKQEAMISLLKRAPTMTTAEFGALPDEDKEAIAQNKTAREALRPVMEKYSREELTKAGVKKFAGIDLAKAAGSPETIQAQATLEVVIRAGEDVVNTVGSAVKVGLDNLLLQVSNAAAAELNRRKTGQVAAGLALDFVGG